MGKPWALNPRLTNRKAYEENRAAIYRRVRLGEPCALCGQPIDLDAPQWIMRDGRRVRAPWSLEVDHIQTLAHGGSATDQENTQPAHRICNQRKGAGRSSAAMSRAVGSCSRDW